MNQPTKAIIAGATPIEGLGPAPSISLPKGGGAIHGIGETFAANPVTGTAGVTVPIAVSPGRRGFGPHLTLTYDSGAGNGPFGLGWTLSLPSITRRTDKGLPLYEDADESDVFLLSDVEELVPALIQEADGTWVRDSFAQGAYVVTRYRPRLESQFARIERWTRSGDGDTYWRSISRDNVVTFYGKTAESRIADPSHPGRVFSWLICERVDDRGNAIVYEYAAENSANVDRSQANERNRTGDSRSANRYLKRIQYGNTPSTLVQPDLAQLSWLFEVVFDYGDGHYATLPPDDAGRKFVTASIAATHDWPVRADPFSRYRACFEVRTYRLCRRVLMFHHFQDELGVADYLVRATEFTYRESPVASFIVGATESGFVLQGDKQTYLKRSLPTLEFEYSPAQVQQIVHEVDPESLANLPSSVEGARYQWLDLDGEGLQSVLAEQGDAWYYKRNVSALTFDYADGQPTASARFEPVTEVTRLPAFAEVAAPRHQFLDLAGDGQLDCVVLEHPLAGFYKRAEDEGWETFTPLASQPNVDWGDPNLRFVDVDGDGHADILITENEIFTWYRSLAEGGFSPPIRVTKAKNEEEGPAIVFADSTQSIFLADMSGDGLSDIVRIRNGEVCYWPNLGYGRFGCKVAMDRAPWFDTPDLFAPRRIRLTDIDGSGPADIIYLASDGVRIYFNQAGNALSESEALAAFPPINNIATAQALDLLGNGTACLVWVSSLPGDARRSMRYVDLMGGEKPHLLVRSRNNLGTETRIFYAPSTKFYLADRQAGRPWVTRLPFPVQTVERVETCDWVSRTRFVTRYAYHHGYYDGIEREFRGFGLVEQRDTEELGALTASGAFPDAVNIDAASYVPPVLTKTWFHTGVYPRSARVSQVYREQYYRESDLAEGMTGLTDAETDAMLLPDTVLPDGLSDNEIREAVLSLKGAMLRQEVYALDGTPAAEIPYSVSERNHTIKRLQPRGGNRHAVFFAHARESIDFHYERKFYDVGNRKLADPRVTHSLILAVDDYGNELQSVAIAYGRRHNDPDPQLTADDRADQRKIHVTYTESAYTNPILASDAYRAPRPAESRTYEIVKVMPAGNVPDVTNIFRLSELAGQLALASDGHHDLPFEDVDAAGATADHPYRRLIGHTRTVYRKDNLTGGLPLGTVEPAALPLERYQLALTAGLLALYRRQGQTLLPNPAAVLRGEGGYVLGDDKKTLGLFPPSDPDGHWWIPSGQIFFSPNAANSADQELATARSHFFLERRFRDPFGHETSVLYDPHDLLVLEIEDPLHNKVTVGERDTLDNITVNRNDYRVLQPALVTDANRNRSEVTFDGLGFVTGTAVMGKATDNPGSGDGVVGMAADLTQSEIDQFFADPRGPKALALLGGATSRMVYDLARFAKSAPTAPTPTRVATIARETHVSDLGPGETPNLQVRVSYSDGFGREIQKKVQAEPGPVPQHDANGRLIVDADGQPVMTQSDVSPRWVGTGWTVFNNKGNPVRQYEPFFSDTHNFEFDVRLGVSPVLFYDPVGRVVATLHPQHTWEKVVFDPWRQETWDANDTVLVADPRADPDVGNFFSRLPDADYLPTWHAHREGGALGAHEQDAARKAAVHAATPTVTYADSLGRAFLTITHNRFKYSNSLPADPPVEQFYRTSTIMDVAGNRRDVIDAKDRVVMHYDHDMLNNSIHHASMEAGERWMLNDVAGKPLYAWDSRNHQFRTVYDSLRRSSDSFLREGAAAEALISRITYGESHPNPEAGNLRGRAVQVFDQAGVVTSEAYDFKGNLLRSRRRHAQAYATTLDWSADVPLDAETYTSTTRYDALNRQIQSIAPHGGASGTVNVIEPVYNDANLLEQVHIWLNQPSEPSGWLDPATANLHAVTNIDYTAKGQRARIDYGNGVSTFYTYDPLTFRLVHLLTRRDAGAFPQDCPLPAPVGWPGCQVQNLSYTYDPAGNITHLHDDAQQTIYFRNIRVEPSADYLYDALYRLIEATGREHLGQIGGAPITHSYNDAPRAGLAWSANDGNAMGTYFERYVYDAVGNFLQMQHRGSDPAHAGWTRTYAYEDASLIEPGKASNRLSRTTTGVATETYSTGGDGYDAHGGLLRMPQLQAMQWDFRDQLQMTRRQAVNAGDSDGAQRQGERTYYRYDSVGRRVRKVTELSTGQVKEERIYLGGFEIYRAYGANPLVRETLHIMDDKRCIAMVETRTQGNDAWPRQLIRYQFGNHVGSATLELDDAAQIISYEEYTPYGSTSYQAVRSQTETPKRYRYTGAERDEESGLCHHGARYYAPWLGRWTSCDPLGTVDNVNRYGYVHANPTGEADSTGFAGEKPPTGGDPPKDLQLYLSESRAFDFDAIATAKTRGFTPAMKAYARKVVDFFGGPEAYDRSDRVPFVDTKAGTRRKVGIEASSANRSRGASVEKMKGGIRSGTGGVDPEAPPGVRYNQPKPPALEGIKPKPLAPVDPSPDVAAPGDSGVGAADVAEPSTAADAPQAPEAPGVAEAPAPAGKGLSLSSAAEGAAMVGGLVILAHDVHKAPTKAQKVQVVKDAAKALPVWYGLGVLGLGSAAIPLVATRLAQIGMQENYVPHSMQMAIGRNVVQGAFNSSADDVELLERMEIPGTGLRPFSPTGKENTMENFEKHVGQTVVEKAFNSSADDTELLERLSIGGWHPFAPL